MSDKTIPTKWFNTLQITTWVSKDIPTDVDNGHGTLVVLHQCGEDKEALIGQLKTMINGLENNFDWFTNG